jgi:CHASE3 domain sensor protein
VAGLALLVATAVLLLSAERDLRKSNEAVQRTNNALLQLAEINSLVIGVDYSARGYALTGEKLFLDHENEKQHDLRVAISDLSRLAGPDLGGDIVRLSRLVDRHAAVYAQFVKRGPGRTAEMAALITNPTERQKRYDALNAIDQIHAELMSSLVAHQAHAETQQHYSLILTFVIVATAFLGGIMEVAVRTVFRRRGVGTRGLPLAS